MHQARVILALILMLTVALVACGGDDDSVDNKSPLKTGEEVIKYLASQDTSKLKKLTCDPDNVGDSSDRIKLEFGDSMRYKTNELGEEYHYTIDVMGPLKVTLDGTTRFDDIVEWQLYVRTTKEGKDGPYCLDMELSDMDLPGLN